MAKEGNVPEPGKRSYHEYIRRVKDYLKTDEAEADRNYWLDTLTGFKGISYRSEQLKKAIYTLGIPEGITSA